jgi:uncharacterized delta-60 repeat protein
MLIGGYFTAVGSQPRNYLARLNGNGTLDTNFTATTDGPVYTLAVQADGRIVVGGGFATAGGAPRNNAARLQADGSLDTGFNPNADAAVFSAVLQADGKLLLGGPFTAIGGQPRHRIARLNADGSLDATFNPDADSGVFSLAMQADGKVILGGAFTAIGGQPYNRLARLSNDTATQSLTVPSPSRVQWLRGGAAPEAQDVAFELSTDGGASWTALGAGVRIAGSWELAGLSLQGSGQVRARARVVSGIQNGSSGLVEAVAAFEFASAPRLTGVTWLGPGSFRFGFTNAPGLTFTTLVSTNLLLPLNQWTNIGPATEVLPGQYQFTVTDALSRHHCFYSVRSP